MEIEQIKGNRKVQEKQIVVFEKEIGYKLPKAYREFLLVHNGGVPNPDIFKTKNNKYESDVRAFFSLSINEDSFNLRHHYILLQDRLHKSSLAIGYTSAGDFIILKLTSGQVLFFDHEIENLFLISYSFKTFATELYSLEEEEGELETAINKQDIAYFKKIIDNGTNINEIVNEYGQLIPEAAALWDKLELLKYFVQNGAKLDGILLSACGRGRKEIVEYLLTIPEIDIEETTGSSNNDTPFIATCYGGHLEVAKMLIEAGADINKFDKNGNNALNKAMWVEHKEVIIFLRKLYKSK